MNTSNTSKNQYLPIESLKHIWKRLPDKFALFIYSDFDLQRLNDLTNGPSHQTNQVDPKRLSYDDILPCAISGYERRFFGHSIILNHSMATLVKTPDEGDVAGISLIIEKKSSVYKVNDKEFRLRVLAKHYFDTGYYRLAFVKNWLQRVDHVVPLFAFSHTPEHTGGGLFTEPSDEYILMICQVLRDRRIKKHRKLLAPYQISIRSFNGDHSRLMMISVTSDSPEKL